jgi:hypothetical protein
MIFEEKDWETLLPRIRAGNCTPFLGAAVNLGVLPLGGEVAQRWATDFKYPPESKSDLSKVSQYLAISSDATRPKEMILEMLDKYKSPFDLNDDAEPLNVLSKLPLPVYLTTNYDDLLFAAINRDVHHRSFNALTEAAHGCLKPPPTGWMTSPLPQSVLPARPHAYALVRRLACLLHASFRPHLAARPFALRYHFTSIRL